MIFPESINISQAKQKNKKVILLDIDYVGEYKLHKVETVVLSLDGAKRLLEGLYNAIKELENDSGRNTKTLN